MKIYLWRNSSPGLPKRVLVVIIWVVAFLCDSEIRGQLAWNTVEQTTNVSPETRFLRSEYYFTNLSQVPIKLTQTHADCGWQLVEWPTLAVKPNEYGKIVLEMDIANETGMVKKLARVATDEIAPHEYILTASVNIAGAIFCSTKHLKFNLTNLVTQTVTFSNSLMAPIRIQAISYGCSIDKPVELLAGKTPGRMVELRVRPPQAERPYTIGIIVIIQEHLSGIEKQFHLKATVN